ncbi:sterol carrier family protein [Actinoplanes sp. NPDC051346]|uniref:sterol carrier family protein n=1 Tax=Actinoplanes sp. NPDC051346 TaxID=3155048 RepID=UPI00342D1DCE
MSPAHNKSESVGAALDALDGGGEPDRSVLRDAVRALLSDLARTAPGRSVEVRIPPFGAIQCVAGPRHTRGTPPNVVETDPMTWLLVATGRLGWSDAVDSGRVRASGTRTDLAPYLPVHPS